MNLYILCSSSLHIVVTITGYRCLDIFFLPKNERIKRNGRVMRNVMGLNGAAMKIKLILWIYLMP